MSDIQVSLVVVFFTQLNKSVIFIKKIPTKIYILLINSIQIIMVKNHDICQDISYVFLHHRKPRDDHTVILSSPLIIRGFTDREILVFT